MNRFLALFLLAFVNAPSLTCGSSGRHLASIAISKMANGTQIEFAATGTFSSSPTTVNPLAVDWSMGAIAPPTDAVYVHVDHADIRGQLHGGRVGSSRG
jgi:hypothetical protein